MVNMMRGSDEANKFSIQMTMKWSSITTIVQFERQNLCFVGDECDESII